MDLVVIARGQAVDASYEALGQALTMALTKVHQRLEKDAARALAQSVSKSGQ